MFEPMAECCILKTVLRTQFVHTNGMMSTLVSSADILVWVCQEGLPIYHVTGYLLVLMRTESIVWVMKPMHLIALIMKMTQRMECVQAWTMLELNVMVSNLYLNRVTKVRYGVK